MKKCIICDLDESNTRIMKSKIGLLCRKHYLQYYRHGKILDRTRYTPNTYIEHPTYYSILLYNNEGEVVGEVMIDKYNLDICKRYKWSIYKAPHTNYAVTHMVVGGKDMRVSMHKMLYNFTDSADGVVDHINHNGLDNRSCNIRIASKSLNASNSYKKYAGITKVPSGNYQCTVWFNYKRIYLGTFKTKDIALHARELKLKELYKI